MFSHGALMPGIVDEPLPMVGHAIRFAAQWSVLSVLLTLSDLLPRENENTTGERERS